MSRLRMNMETMLLNPELRTCALCHQPVKTLIGQLVLNTENEPAAFYHTQCARKLEVALHKMEV